MPLDYFILDMKIFKFGGAAIKNATRIINVANILKSEGYNDTVLVISAMGKMTNAFEDVVESYIKKEAVLAQKIAFVREYHFNIIKELFEENHEVNTTIDLIFLNLSSFFTTNKNLKYDYVYDQIVSFAEILSTTIISAYFKQIGIENTLLDARKLIVTNTNYRNAKVNWEKTYLNINNTISDKQLYITQGFIAGASATKTTTLGREGSDYSAAIIAHCLNAKSLSIWKDVPGVLNADPRYFESTTLLNQISYSEALEMAFYGASVIHPKTIKPLENKNIPLHVRSFIDLDEVGTVIKKGADISPKIPCYTRKENQILLSLSAKDFSFMIEHNISHIFQLFAQYKVTVNLIQNSAISFSVCIEDSYNQFDALHQELMRLYKVVYHKKVSLLTIRHFTKKSVTTVAENNKILLTQQTLDAVQFVMR